MREGEVLEVVDDVADADPIVVDGQSGNVRAKFHLGSIAVLAGAGPYTSGNEQAAKQLASSLVDVIVLLPTLSDMATPNAAVVMAA